MKRLKGHFANETAVATPNGQFLGAWPRTALAKWQKLGRSERTRLEDLGKYDPALDPRPPHGGLVLKVFARPLERGPRGQWQVYRNPKSHLTREPGRDFLWLTAAEWQSLVPARPTKGLQRAVPTPLVDRLCRRYLIDLVRVGGNGGPHAPQSVRSQELWLQVEETSPACLRLRLHGSARFDVSGSEHGPARTTTYRLAGRLDYDPRRKAFTRFDVVALSETGHYDQHGRVLRPLGVAFELSPARKPADLVRPSSLYQSYFAASK
jgi:hypothetical protein